MSSVKGKYDANAFDGREPLKKGPDTEERALMKKIEETVNSEGYAILHKIMMEEIEIATNSVANFNKTGDEIRFNQGVLHGITTVRHRFLKLMKEETYAEKPIG